MADQSETKGAARMWGRVITAEFVLFVIGLFLYLQAHPDLKGLAKAATIVNAIAYVLASIVVLTGSASMYHLAQLEKGR